MQALGYQSPAGVEPGWGSSSKTGKYFAANPNASIPAENIPMDIAISGIVGIYLTLLMNVGI